VRIGFDSNEIGLYQCIMYHRSGSIEQWLGQRAIGNLIPGCRYRLHGSATATRP